MEETKLNNSDWKPFDFNRDSEAKARFEERLIEAQKNIDAINERERFRSSKPIKPIKLGTLWKNQQYL